MIDTLDERTRLVVQAAFGGRRVVICSGGEVQGETEILQEVEALNKGGACGSIVGRNAFQRPEDEAIQLLHKIQDTYISKR